MRVFHSAAVVALCVILTACSKDDDKTQSASGVAPAVAAGPSEAEKVALLATLPAPYNTGDLANGQRKFALCRSCHTIAEGGPALTGPNLDLLAEIVRRRPDLQVQASGGVAALSDLPAARDLGCAGAIVGRALYEGRFTVEQALDAVR